MIKYVVTMLLFTFQYGATSTEINKIVLYMLAEFTFQYGATSTRIYIGIDFTTLYPFALSPYKI